MIHILKSDTYCNWKTCLYTSETCEEAIEKCREKFYCEFKCDGHYDGDKLQEPLLVHDEYHECTEDC